ncbi:MAG: hypothetical protein Q8Q90_01890 [bacterium]|nr:hypothetical protein [bacterium]
MPKKTDNMVTKKYLDETLDKRFAEQSQIIVSAVGEMMDKKLTTVAKNINSLQTSLEKKMDETKDELKANMNKVQTLMDGYVKDGEEFKQKFVLKPRSRTC